MGDPSIRMEAAAAAPGVPVPRCSWPLIYEHCMYAASRTEGQGDGKRWGWPAADFDFLPGAECATMWMNWT